jgi:hypothetical protein
MVRVSKGDFGELMVYYSFRFLTLDKAGRRLSFLELLPLNRRGGMAEVTGSPVVVEAEGVAEVPPEASERPLVELFAAGASVPGSPVTS